MPTYSTVSTEAASEGLDDLKMEIKKADDMIHKHLPHQAHASKPKKIVATYTRSRVGVVEECQKFLERMETEIALIEERAAGEEALQNEAAIIGRIHYCILETQSVQETLKVMEESKEEFEKAWEELDKAEEEWEDAKEAMDKAEEEWEKAKEAREKAEAECQKIEAEYDKAKEAREKAEEEWDEAEEGWDKAMEEWDKAEEEYEKAKAVWEARVTPDKAMGKWCKASNGRNKASKELRLKESVVKGLRRTVEEEGRRMKEERRRIREKNVDR
jgi:tetratricopeptide (TPR) repeat protein